MIIGQVVGSLVSTRKYDEIQGLKLLLIEPYYGNKETPFVAADTLGAGTGELVIVTFGKNTQYGLKKDVPIDALVVGILDQKPAWSKKEE